MRAYTRSVPLLAAESQSRPAAASERMARRRRPPSSEEQARRKAWGRKYGRLVSELTAQWRKEGN